MEDLGARLEQLLSDPQALSQIGELAASLGLGQPPENGAAASPAAKTTALGLCGETVSEVVNAS